LLEEAVLEVTHGLRRFEGPKGHDNARNFPALAQCRGQGSDDPDAKQGCQKAEAQVILEAELTARVGGNDRA
jgi:hypothetical protein